jgi:hypothetical protein
MKHSIQNLLKIHRCKISNNREIDLEFSYTKKFENLIKRKFKTKTKKQVMQYITNLIVAEFKKTL